MVRSDSKVTAPSIGVVIAVVIGLTWAVHSAVGFTNPNYGDPVTLLDWLSVLSFSAGLAALAPGGWLITELSGGARFVGTAATVLGIGGIVAAVGNFVEDGLGLKAWGDVFASGLLGVLAALIALVGILLFSRRFALATLAAATFAGLMLSAEAGGFLILAAWLAVAAGLRRA
jgi:hypothetical protein